MPMNYLCVGQVHPHVKEGLGSGTGDGRGGGVGAVAWRAWPVGWALIGERGSADV